MIRPPEYEAWCGGITRQLSEFIDGELAADEAWRVTIHLGVCQACGRFAAELAATVEALHSLARRGGRARTPPR